jgi:hypothetical protein
VLLAGGVLWGQPGTFLHWAGACEEVGARGCSTFARVLLCAGLLCRMQFTELPPSVAGWAMLQEASFRASKLKALPKYAPHYYSRATVCLPLRGLICLPHPLPVVHATLVSPHPVLATHTRTHTHLPCSEIVAWTKCRLIDVKSGGKKDTCKVAAEVKEALAECRMVGAVVAKAKGKKK